MLGLISAIVSVLVPVLVNFLKKVGLLPKDASKEATTAHRQWVKEAVVEFVTAFDSRLPWWIKPEEGLIESLLADAIDKALDAAGL